MRSIPRWGITIADQGAIAISNLLMSVAVSRLGGLDELGKFAIINSTLLIGVGLFRMLLTEPWLLSTRSLEPTPQLRGLIWVAPVPVAAAVGLAAGIVGGEPVWFLAIGVALAWIPQDAGRFIAFKSHRPIVALRSDIAALVVVAGGFTYISLTSLETPLLALLGTWALAQGVALALVSGMLAGATSIAGARRWWTHVCRTSALALSQDSVAYLLANNVSLYLLAVVASVTDVGLVRVVMSIFSPVALVFTGLNMWLIPVLARSGVHEGRAMQRRISLTLAIFSAPALLLAVLVGPTIADVVFNADRALSPFVILMGGLSICAIAVGSPWVAGAKVLERYRPVAWARTASAIVILGSLWLLPGFQSTTGYLELMLGQNVAVGVVAFLVQRGSRYGSPPSVAWSARRQQGNEVDP